MPETGGFYCFILRHSGVEEKHILTAEEEEEDNIIDDELAPQLSRNRLGDRSGCSPYGLAAQVAGLLLLPLQEALPGGHKDSRQADRAVQPAQCGKLHYVGQYGVGCRGP